MTVDLNDRLTTIEQTQTIILRRLEDLLSQRKMKDFYSVEEVAERVERTPYQVRHWLLNGRMLGDKRHSGRGRSKEWQVGYEELDRYLNHGLRPPLNPARN
jgi:predicted transcriptional regulator